MTTRFADHLLDGVHASRPAATAVPTGTLYACSDHALIYQSDGAAWSTWATLGAPAYTDEQVRDVMAATLVQGSNVTITPDDAADTISIAAAAGGGGAPVPLWVRKAANESVTSSTTLQDDDHLTLTLAANSTYRFEAMLMIYGATAADIKLCFPRLNTNWEIFWGPIGPASSLTTAEGSAAWYAAFNGGDTTLVIGTATLSNPMTVLISGSVTTDATGGPLKLQWAQNTSSTTATTIYKGSHLMAQKVA